MADNERAVGVTTGPPTASAAPALDVDQVGNHLAALGYRPGEITVIGAGYWSVCFGFISDGQSLVIRFGHNPEDFDLDRAAHRFNGPKMTVPQVLDVGLAFTEAEDNRNDSQNRCWYAISERIPGQPLESVTAEHWESVVPSVVDALETMRQAPLPDKVGWGSWTSIDDDDGVPIGSHQTWRDYLLSVADEPNDGRIAGWKDNLSKNRERFVDFDWGLRRLDELTDDDGLLASVVKGVTHQDMLNRNVHVVEDRVSGLFDWGCAAYADHLYEYSLFEFWNPWHQHLDIKALRAELERTWDASGLVRERIEDRLRVCHLHNGLVHIMYGAYLQNWDTLGQTVDRMRELSGDA